MRNRRSTPTYNILLPIWLLVWFPSWLWLLLIPANFLVDWLVLRWSLKGEEDGAAFALHNAWKVCVMGFLSDFAGTVVLIAAMVLLDTNIFGPSIAQALTMNPFAHPVALIITLAAIALAALCIRALDRMVLKGAGLDPDLADKTALRLAIITAPYLFLIPASLLYR